MALQLPVQHLHGRCGSELEGAVTFSRAGLAATAAAPLRQRLWTAGSSAAGNACWWALKRWTVETLQHLRANTHCASCSCSSSCCGDGAAYPACISPHSTCLLRPGAVWQQAGAVAVKHVVQHVAHGGQDGHKPARREWQTLTNSRQVNGKHGIS